MNRKLLLAGSVLGVVLAAGQAGAQSPDDPAYTVEEVVVTGEFGAVEGDIRPEQQISAEDVQGLGLGSLTEVLEEVAAQVGNDSSAEGVRQTTVLLNGRPTAGGFGELQDIPTEAIQRIDVLPPETALRFGYSPDAGRVINIVLKESYRAVTAEGTVGVPTAGGQVNGQFNGSRIGIEGDTRINIGLRLTGQNALTEDERDIRRPLSAPFDPIGNVTALDQGEIDPALSALAGTPVLVAGVPSGAGPFSLADFAANANEPNLADVGEFRTLSPRTGQAQLNVVVSRPISKSFRGTLNGTLLKRTTDSLQGLPDVILPVPAGQPGSPFSTPVRLNRYVTQFGPLRSQSDNWSATLNGGVNGLMGRTRLSVRGGYNQSESFNDVGVDISALVAALPNLDPFAPWPSNLITERSQGESRSRRDSVNYVVNLHRPLFSLPAGQVQGGLTTTGTATWSHSESIRLDQRQERDDSQTNFGAQANLNVPLTRRNGSLLGGVSLRGNAGINRRSDVGQLLNFTLGAGWRPDTRFNLNAYFSRQDNAPSAAQLNDPIEFVENQRVFDYVTGRTVDVRVVRGGNPLLQDDSRNQIRLSLNATPLKSQRQLVLNFNYVREWNDNPIAATFPAASAELQAAFPERFQRNIAGDLVQVDYRPVNFDSEREEQVRWGLTFTKTFGAQQPPARGGPPNGRAGAGGEAGPPRARDGQGGQRPQGQAGQPGQGGRGGQGRGGQGQGGQPGPAPGGAAAPEGLPPGAELGQGPPGGFPGGGGFGGGGFGGGGFGGGRGGFGGGGDGFAGRGGGGGAASRALRLRLTFAHTYMIADETVIRPGVPVIDRLNGSAAGDNGGTPRNRVELSSNLSKGPYGGALNLDWREGTTVIAGPGSTTGDLTFSAVTQLTLRAFVTFDLNRDLIAKQPWLKGSRATLEIRNLLDDVQQVRDAAGLTPASFQRGYRPGREVRLTFRKQF